MLRARLRTTSGLTVSAALMAVTIMAAPVAAHVARVAAFDPAAGQLTEGVAVDADGTVYTGFAPLGALVRIPAGADSFEEVGRVDGIGEGDFGLIGMTVGPDGAVYAAVMSQNPDANGVWRFDPEIAAAERVPGTEAIGIPNDVSFDEAGEMYISDTLAGAVWRVSPGGVAESWIQDALLEGTGQLGMGFPLGANGLEVAGDTVYVAVTETAQVVAIPINEDGTAGEPATFVQLDAPVDGVTVDAAGNVWTAHPFVNEVRRVDAAGNVAVVADAGDGLDAPTSLAVGPGPEGDSIYIANFSVALGGELGAGPGIAVLALGE